MSTKVVNGHRSSASSHWPSAVWLSSCLWLILNLANSALCNPSAVENTHKVSKYANESLTEARRLLEDSQPLVWSQLLEDYVLSQSPSSRISKDLPYDHSMSMMNSHVMGPPGMQQPPINYHSSAYQTRPGVVITRRIGDAVELEPHRRPPVVNPQFRPMTNQMLHQQQPQPNFIQQIFGFGGNQQQQQQHPPPRPVPIQHNHPPQQQHSGPQQFRPVSENDLYLLGAIEKLVYRVDYLESRIRRSEQLIYYLMAGNNQKDERDPCPSNFTRISDNCYYINSQQQVNWKTANTECKALGAHLAEFEKVSENEEIMAYLLNQPTHRERDYWLGALNPGLLWIWSNSAKPVNPNTNLTSIAMGTSTESNLIDSDKEDVKKKEPDESVLNNTIEIKGQGRCLRLTYNSTKHSYSYFGQECTSRQHFICELEDKSLDNKIKKLTRDLKLFK